jgi:hypothetical protein
MTGVTGTVAGIATSLYPKTAYKTATADGDLSGSCNLWRGYPAYRQGCNSCETSVDYTEAALV